MEVMCMGEICLIQGTNDFFLIYIVFVHDKLKTSRSLMPRVFVPPSLKAIAYGISGEGSQIPVSQ